jgi:DNA-binding CsgD family transcriptional regulator
MPVGGEHVFGREAELGALVRLLEGPTSLPRAAVLVGDPGIGKTTVWLAATRAAAARGLRVLSSRPAEAETRFSFVGLTDLIGEAAVEALPRLPTPQRRALEATLLLADPDGGPMDERGVALAFLNVLRALAEEGPLVLAIDDVQWLDSSSLAVLRFALARLRDESVLALLACRGELPDWLRRALPEERLQTIELGPLSVGALHELLRTRVSVPFPRPTLVRLWETSRGNPFFALEIARALERRGGQLHPGDDLPIPDTLDDLLHERLDGLSPAARDAARAVAALAEPTSALVESALGAAGATGLDDAVRAGVLELDGERVRFTHPLLGSAVASGAPSSAKRALHARLAAVVSDEERARHLALAASGPDPRVADALETAARRARSRGAPSAGAELAEQALRLTQPADADAMRRRRVEAADHVFEAGDSVRATALLEEALAGLAPGPHRAAILRRLAAVRSVAAGPPEGIALYREALEQTGGDDALEAEIHLELADLLRFGTGIRSAEPHAEAAVRAAESANRRELLCRALATYGLIHFKLGRGIDDEVMTRAVELEEELGLPSWSWGAKAILTDQLFWSHDLDAARTLAQELWEEAHRREDRHEPEHLWYLALIEWRAGNWARAAELADATRALHEQLGDVGLSPANEWPRALIAAHRGRVDEACGWSTDALARAEAAGMGTAEAAHRWVLGFLELSLGNARAALEQLRPAHEIREAVGHGEPGQYWELPDLLDALVAVGELEEAEGLAVRWEERSSALDRAWGLAIAARCRALLLAARGDLTRALSVFEDALAEHARTQDPFQLARTLLAQGTTQRRAKQRGSARKTLERARGLFDELGSPLWAERTRDELARIGGRAPSRDELTPSERRVAALVAEGRTNREVAAALFVTEHTVEAALTRTYRKLGIRSRTELAGRLTQARSGGGRPLKL